MGASDYPIQLIFTIVIIALIVYYIVKIMSTTPLFSFYEGFAGVTRGSGEPDSPRILPEASELLDVLASRGIPSMPSVKASPDYQEFQLILSKLAALKQDLLGVASVVNATRYQEFETAHDRINVAEVCGMCFTHSIPSRDLDIVFITWRDRGRVLLRKLCTEANLTEEQVVSMEKKFAAIWSDVYDIARSRCLATDFSLQHGGDTSGGDVGAYEPNQLKDLRSYEYKYGGMSASGWNGAAV